MVSIQKRIVSMATSCGFLDLGEDGAMEVRIDVGQEEDVGRPVGRRELGLEIGEDVEVGPDGRPLVGILAVAALPVEGLPRPDIETPLRSILRDRRKASVSSGNPRR